MISIINLIDGFNCTLGYVQGMSDLCAPIYVVMSADEEMTFWCFVEVMSRMVSTMFRLGQNLFLTHGLHRNKTSFEIKVG